MWLATPVRAQGPLSPSGTPAESMKTLQELWDRLAVQQTEIQNAQRQNAVLLNALGINLPWLIHTDNFQPSASSSLALDSDGRPTVGFIDRFGVVMFARFDGSAWSFENVNALQANFAVSLAFGPDGKPAIAYQGAVSNDLRMVHFDGTVWQDAAVENSGTAGINPSLAFGPDGQPAIAHSQSNPQQLLCSRFDGVAWHHDIVDKYGTTCSLAFGPDGQPAIAYYQELLDVPPDGTLKFARYDGTDWILSTVATGYHNGIYQSLAFGLNGQPAIASVNPGQDLRYLQFDGSAWNATVVDSSFPDSFYYPSLAIGPDGQPAIAYAQEAFGSLNLKFTRFNGSWNIEIVDDQDRAGYGASLAFGPAGQPVIAYSTFIAAGNLTRLKLARQGTFAPPP